jgi:putative acetyltransferase
LEIRPVRNRTEMADSAKLMIGLVESNKERYSDERQVLDEYYRDSWFFERPPVVPSQYKPPSGDILIAYLNKLPAGTVAICRMDNQYCELKSMFVPPEHRGTGIAVALCDQVLIVARKLRYRCIRLTTGEKQPEAQTLYRKLGFQVVVPWDENPPAGFSYFEKALESDSAAPQT